MQPIGVAGELCIAGAGLGARVSEPSGIDGGEIRGESVCARRADVQDRGFGEMAAGREHRVFGADRPSGENPGLPDRARGDRSAAIADGTVKEAIVIARENEQGQNELMRYVVAEEELTVAQLREALSQTLPSYMIPAYFVQLEKLPLTPNGKIDRKALPLPDGKLSTGVVYVAPRNETEQALAEIWQGLLKAERVGVHDNFFELGGDSIKAIQVMSRLHARGWKLEMKHLFQAPTLERLRSRSVRWNERFAGASRRRSGTDSDPALVL